jgi:ketosteroid isomerase-like protein
MKRITVVAFGTLIFALAGSSASAQTEKETLASKDKQVYETIKNHDVKGFESLLTDDSIIVQGAEIQTKQAMSRIVGDTQAGTLNVTLEDVQVFMPVSDAAIVTFKSKRDFVDPSGKHETTEMRESTLWVKKNGKWLSAFHDFSPLVGQK